MADRHELIANRACKIRTIRDFERFLRNAGFSRSAAKCIAAPNRSNLRTTAAEGKSDISGRGRLEWLLNPRHQTCRASRARTVHDPFGSLLR